MFGLSKREKIEKRELKRCMDEAKYFNSILQVSESGMGNTFKPKDNFCDKCGAKNHLRARFCNNCGAALPEDRAKKDFKGRMKLHADIAHPINAECRRKIQEKVIAAFKEDLANIDAKVKKLDKGLTDISDRATALVGDEVA